MGVEGFKYSQDNTAENFEAQEVQRVIEETKKQLWLLELDVLNAKKLSESKWWDDIALNKASDLLWNFYEIKKIGTEYWNDWFTKEKVVFHMDAINSYLENILKRLSAPWAPKYTEMANEKIFWATVLAIQIALECINRPSPQIGKYDVWVISWKLDWRTKKAIEEFQWDHKWLEIDGKPWKWTIEIILRELKEQTNGLDLEKSTLEPPTMIAPVKNILPPLFNNEHADEGNSPVHEVLWPGVEIIREGDIASYVVQKNDTTTSIRDKLAQYPEFEYLKDRSYRPTETNWRSTIGLNIRNDSLRAMAKAQETVFIPSKIEDRKMEAGDFFKKCKESVTNMKDTVYADRIQNLVNKVGIDKIAKVMTAFAKCESNLWEQWLYRYESANSYSLSYFHILMSWGWLKARNNLRFSEAGTFDPINAGMLFLGFWCETKNWDLSRYFNLEPGWQNRCASVYNSRASRYPWKLKWSYDAIKNRL